MATEMADPRRTRRAALYELRDLRPGFLVIFSVAGLVGVALVAFVVSQILAGELRSAQLTSSTRSAELLVQSSLGPRLAGHGGHLTEEQLDALDQSALAARSSAGLASVSIWGRHSRILYSTNHHLIGAPVALTPEATVAFSGKTSATVRSRGPSRISSFAGKQTDVAVPIYAPRVTQPVAVAEVVSSYAPVAQQVSDETQRIDLILFGGALLFYASLWPRLLRASRATRSQSDPRKKALLRDLENAIKRDELLLHYQPTIDLDEGRVTGVEALLRWRNPKRGLLAPSEFLPAIVDDTMNRELALHVIGMALRDCEAWRARGIDAGVNVNLSVPNVLDEELCEQIGGMLGSAGIPPGALGLEVTETALVADPDTAATMLRALDRLGVRVCIDDFGTGYSSLAALRDLPVSELKVDRQFIAGLHTKPRDRMIVSLIIKLAHELDVSVIAEGVEDGDTLDDLAELACDQAQGHFFSPPLPLAELVEWFEAPVAAGRDLLREPAAAV